MYCGCKSRIVFAAQCAVCVSPVLYLHYCQPSVPCVSPVLYLHYCQCSESCMCVSFVLYLHYCQRSMTCKLVLYCMHVHLHYCCACEFCIVFALLPGQCAVLVSSVMCLDYCQGSVL